MRKSWAAAVLPVLVFATMLVDEADADGRRKEEVFTARLIGYDEVPSVSTPARGWFTAKIDRDGGKIDFWLWYSPLDGAVTQAHLHFGQHHVAGGISVFLCSNLGNGPQGTQACPPGPASVSGTLQASDVIGPTAQGIEPGQFAELLAAIRAGAVYANVHSDKFPAGEIRGQLDR